MNEKGERLKITAHTNMILFKDDLLISDDDELICLPEPGSKFDVFLLVYSLINNAFGRHRCIKDTNNINVYLTKIKDGDNNKILRISNLPLERNEKKISRVNERTNYFPSNQNDGISLWSISRYLYRFLFSLGMQHMSYLKTHKVYDFEAETNKIKNILSNGYNVKVRYMRSEKTDQTYFVVEAPIFFEHYNKSFISEGGSNEESSDY